MNLGAAFNFCTGILIAGLPLFQRASFYDVGRLSKDFVAFAFMLLASLALTAQRQIDWGILALIMGGAFFCLFNQWEPASISVQYQSFMIIAGLVFLGVFYRGHDSSSLRYILNGAAIGCVIQSLLCVSQFAGFDIYPHIINFILGTEAITKPHFGVFGSLGNPNLLAAYVSITAMALLRPGWVLLMPLALFAVIASKSAMGFCTLIAGVAFFYRPKRIHPAWFYGLALLGIALLFLFGGFGIDTGRVKIWTEIFEKTDFITAIIGKGPGWFFDQRFLDMGLHAAQEHNEILAIFNVGGIVALVILGIFFKRLFKYRDTNPLFEAIAFAGFFNSLGHFTFHQSTTVILIIISVGVCLSKGESDVLDLEW